MPVDQPMDIAVAVWRCNTDPDYFKHLSDAAASASKFYRARALRLIELCEACDHPSDFYQEVEQFRPDAYVVAELVKMAKMARDSERAKAGATARHGENRAMKADVFSWLDANMSNFGSMASRTRPY